MTGSDRGDRGDRGGRDGEAVGTLEEEATRFVEALGVLFGGVPRADPADPAAAPHRHGAGSAPECRICPICRLLAGLRELRPEVVAHLVTAGEELLEAARAFSASSSPTQGTPGPPGTPPAAPAPSDPAGSAAPARVVQRIEIED